MSTKRDVLTSVGTQVDTQPNQRVVHYSDTFHLITAATLSLDGTAVYEVKDRIMFDGKAIIVTRQRITCEGDAVRNGGDIQVDTSGLTVAQIAAFAERLKVASSPFLRAVGASLSGRPSSEPVKRVVGKKKAVPVPDDDGDGDAVEEPPKAAVRKTGKGKDKAKSEEKEMVEVTDAELDTICEGASEARSFKKDIPSELRVTTSRKGDFAYELMLRGGAWTLYADEDENTLGVANQAADDLNAAQFEHVKTFKGVTSISAVQGEKEIVEVEYTDPCSVQVFVQYKEKKGDEKKAMAFFIRRG